MTKDEALKLALEALEWNLPVIEDHGVPNQLKMQHKAITSIYESLAQPEPGGVCGRCGGWVCDPIPELAQPEQEPLAFYVYKPTLPRGNLGNVSDGDLPWVYDQDPSSGYSARMLVYTTPPQPEPVIDKSAAVRIATALGWEPKRTWVGLTEKEYKQVINAYFGTGLWAMAKNIEAKLKEKNT